MANMSYCMFENTYSDLLDCVRRLEEDGYSTVYKESSEYEQHAMEHMLMLCKRYMEAFEQHHEEFIEELEEEYEVSPFD